jgi:hypothetical protein
MNDAPYALHHAQLANTFYNLVIITQIQHVYSVVHVHQDSFCLVVVDHLLVAVSSVLQGPSNR